MRSRRSHKLGATIRLRNAAVEPWGLGKLDTIIFRYSPLSTLIAILCASVLVWAFLGREERALNGRSAPNELLTAKADHGSILYEERRGNTAPSRRSGSKSVFGEVVMRNGIALAFCEYFLSYRGGRR
jgi:hypothetical protein